MLKGIAEKMGMGSKSPFSTLPDIATFSNG
jgi:hypothetical protein